MKRSWLLIYKVLSFFFPEERGCRFRNALLRRAGAVIGKHVTISPRAIIEGTGKLIIEDEVFIGPGTLITANGTSTVHIKKNTQIAHFVSIKTTTHCINSTIFKDGVGYTGGGGIMGRCQFLDITIEEGCWICAGVIILPGVTVHQYSVCAAGTVVTHDVPPCSLVAGVPGVIKKTYSVEIK